MLRRDLPLKALLVLAPLACGRIAEETPLPPPPSTEITTLAEVSSTGDLVVDEHALYLAEPSGSVVRIAKDGSGTTTLASNLASASRLAADATSLFLDTSAGVVRIDKATGAMATLSPGHGLAGVGASSVLRVETTGGSLEHAQPVTSKLLAVPTSGGAERVLFTADKGLGDVVGVDDTSGFFLESGALRALDLRDTTASPRTVALAPPSASALAIAVDADHVFVADESGIHAAPKSGGPFTELAHTSELPLRAAVDATHVYFTQPSAGLVLRVAKAGGPVETVASGQARPVAIAVDEARVYWTNLEAGTLVARRK